MIVSKLKYLSKIVGKTHFTYFIEYIYISTASDVHIHNTQGPAPPLPLPPKKKTEKNKISKIFC